MAASAALLLFSVALAAEQQQQQQSAVSSGCQAAPNATSAHEQIIKLSELLDPSGKLSKMIADYHPHPAHQHAGHSPAGADLQAAASEPEPVKRETAVQDAPAANATEAPATTLASLLANATTSVPASTAAAAASESTTAAASATQAAPPATANKEAAANSTQTPQVVGKSGDSKNVTVNVFLQLVPDAKTDELVSVVLRNVHTLKIKIPTA